MTPPASLIKSIRSPVLLLPVDRLDGELQREARYRNLALHRGPENKWISEDTDWVWCEEKVRIEGFFPIESIQKSATHLKSIDRRWCHLPFDSFRRGELIVEALPRQRFEPLLAPPSSNSAALPRFRYFGLVSRDEGFYSSPVTASARFGKYAFQENKSDPPSRAYLKLWEAFTRIGAVPRSDETVVDLGSCPGGWTWVLAHFSGKTYSVDGASITPEVSRMPGVEFLKKDAFALAPVWDKKIDWLLSDMICDPDRLYELVTRWLAIKPELKCVCTLKFKGESSFETISRFQSLPNSSVIHLHHNKHELTWIHLPTAY